MPFKFKLDSVRWRSFLVATFASFLLASAFTVVMLQYVQEHNRSHEIGVNALMNGELMATRAGLESALYQRLSLPIALKAFVTSDPNFSETDFSSFANSLKDSVAGVMSLQLAPDAVVRYVTNPKQNQKALGHDLLGDAARRPAVLRSIEERKFIVAGPLDLIQGGRALIARLPIFIEDHLGSTGLQDFWGFATILIDVDALLSGAGIYDIDPRIDISIRGVDGLGEEGGLIIGDIAAFDQADRIVDLLLPNGSWQLTATPRSAAFSHEHPWFHIGATVSGLSLTILIWVLVYRQGSSDLRRAKEQAEAASRAKTEFLGTLSHELRTPLTVILGHAGLIEKQKARKPVRALIEALNSERPDLSLVRERLETVIDQTATQAHLIGNSSSHLLDLITELLDYSQIESGNIKLEKEQVHIDKLAEQVAQEMAIRAMQKGITLDVETAPAVARVDKTRLRQVLINITGNAIKFTDIGRVVIGVKVHDDLITMTVSDTGRGIPKEDHDRIFEAFEQVGQVKNRSHEGVGLGLAISRKLVRLHGGEINFAPGQNGGSVFTITLPAFPPS